MGEVVFYKRMGDWIMGNVYGSQVIRQKAEYLFERDGLKICGFYEFDGTYNISEAHSGYKLASGVTKEAALEKLNSADFSRLDIGKVKKLALYYGVPAVHSHPYHVVRDNTLLSNKKAQKRYYARGGK